MSLRRALRVFATSAAVAAAGTFWIGSTAHAQGAPGDQPADSQAQRAGRGQLEEIVVTGTKREQAQQDTPIAISTVTSSQIENTFQSDIRTLTNLSPNLTITNITGFNAVAPGIRGTQTGVILVMQDATVGMLIDDFALSHVQAQFVELFDIQQVEVYRGPQGTLFGKNTAGGVVSITTKKPDLTDFGADLAITYGGYSSGGGDIARLKAAFDLPIIEDKLGFRLAAVYDYNDGYYENSKNTATFPNSVPAWSAAPPLGFGFGIPEGTLPPPGLNTPTKGDGGKLGGLDILAGKAKLLYRPNDFYEGYAIYELVRDRSDSPPGVNETPAGNGVSEDYFLLEQLGFPGIQQAGEGNEFRTGVTNQGAPITIRNGHKVNADGFYLYNTFNFDDLFGLGSYQLKSITGYRYHTETLPSTYTGEAYLSLFDATRNLERNMNQQELRLVSDLDGPFNFVLGGVYFRDDVDFHVYATVGLSGLIPSVHPMTGTFLDPDGFVNLRSDFRDDPTTTSAKQKRDSWAIYWDGSYQLTEQLRISAGVRYTVDEKEFWRDQNPGGECDVAAIITPPEDRSIVDGVCLDARSNTISRSGKNRNDVSQRHLPLQSRSYEIKIQGEDEDWDKVTWRVALDYRITDEVMLYFTTATGFTAGGFTETCSSLATCEPFDEEESLNFEGGFKGDFFANTLRANLAVFYTEYDDLQRNQVVPFTNAFGVTTQETITVNAAESTAWGVELEMTWVPLPDFRWDLGVSYLDNEYDDFDVVLPCSPNIFREIGRADVGMGIPGCGDQLDDDASFLEPPFSQDWQLGTSVTYDLRLDFGTLTLNANLNYQSKGEFSAFNSTRTHLHERTLLGFFIRFTEPGERWFLTVWGQNMLNERYRVSANSVAGLWNFTQYGPPRSAGIEFGVSL